MADDYARSTGAAHSVVIDATEYRVSKFTPRDIGDLQAWLKSEIPDPRLEAKKMLEGLSDAVAIEVWRSFAAAAKDWPPTLGSDKGNELLTTSTEGVARLLWVALRKHNNVDLAKARELANVVGLADVNEVVRLASPESAEAPKP